MLMVAVFMPVKVVTHNISRQPIIHSVIVPTSHFFFTRRDLVHNLSSRHFRKSSKNLKHKNNSLINVVYYVLLKGSNLHSLECHYLEKCGPKIQDYIISCNINIISFVLW